MAILGLLLALSFGVELALSCQAAERASPVIVGKYKLCTERCSGDIYCLPYHADCDSVIWQAYSSESYDTFPNCLAANPNVPGEPKNFMCADTDNGYCSCVAQNDDCPHGKYRLESPGICSDVCRHRSRTFSCVAADLDSGNSYFCIKRGVTFGPVCSTTQQYLSEEECLQYGDEYYSAP